MRFDRCALVVLAVHASSALQADSLPDAYLYDPAFNGGFVLEDRFAAVDVSASMYGSRLARLPDGDLVVAGQVTSAFGDEFFASNIGLVRYGPDGGRIPWSQPTPGYSYFDGRYVDYPNSASGPFSGVKAIVATGEFIYVLADRQATSPDVSIVAFGDDGSFIGEYPAFDTPLVEKGAGLVAYTVPGCVGVLACTRLIAVATYTNGIGRDVITAKRFQVGMNAGTLVVDTSFGPFGNGANDYPMPDYACDVHADCSVSAAGATLVRGENGAPTVYVAATSLYEAWDEDTAVLAIDGATGSPVAAFGAGGGFSWNPIQIGADRAVAIVVRAGAEMSSDRIYVVGQADTECPGSADVTIVAVAGGTGLRDTGFGNDGVVAFGGSHDPNACTATAQAMAAAITPSGERIVVAGRGTWTELEPNHDLPMFASVSARDGHVMQRLHANPPQPAGAPWTEYALFDVVAGHAGTFLATGALIDHSCCLFPTYSFGTVRYASDRIFGATFEQPETP